MDFNKFTNIFSQPRISRYCNAVNGNEKKAIKLYQYNIKLSQEMFSIISCFEVILRNAINEHFTKLFGSNWLNKFTEEKGNFDENIVNNKKENPKETLDVKKTKEKIISAKNKLGNKEYSLFKHIAEIEFGIWCAFFKTAQYKRTQYKKNEKEIIGLAEIFKRGTTHKSDNINTIKSELKKINKIRNRIAHHEPICFKKNEIDTKIIRENYSLILKYLDSMDIDGKNLLNQLKLNRVMKICNKIDYLNKKKTPQ